jgi:hypothetical protein
MLREVMDKSDVPTQRFTVECGCYSGQGHRALRCNVDTTAIPSMFDEISPVLYDEDPCIGNVLMKRECRLCEL